MIALALALAAIPAGIGLYNAAMAVGMRRARANQRKGTAISLTASAAPASVLLFHGYIGSPTDLGRLPELLHHAGFTVRAPLLPGHGTDPRDFSRVTSAQLIEFALAQYDAVAAMRRPVYLIGFSLGGSLAAIVAARRSAAKLVLVAPFFQIAHQWYYGLPTEWHHRIFSPVIPYVYRFPHFKQVNDRAAAAALIDYDYVSMRGAGASLTLGRVALESVPNVAVPMLVLQSRYDRATDFRTTQRLIATHPNNNARLVTVHRSNHVLLVDYDHATIESEILAFIKEPHGPAAAAA